MVAYLAVTVAYLAVTVAYLVYADHHWWCWYPESSGYNLRRTVR